MRGPARARSFRWEETAKLTVAAYKAAILRPSERSLRARQQLGEIIMSWSHHGLAELKAAQAPPESNGIRNALWHLNRAVHTRVRRDVSRVLTKSRMF